MPGKLFTVVEQCLLGLFLLQIGVAAGDGGPRACSVPEPGLPWLACEFEVDTTLENIPFTRDEAVRWNSEQQFKVGLPSDLFNATVYLTNPVMGNISSVIEQCASVGRSLATSSLLRIFWELYTEYPATQAIHPWFKSLAWDGHHGPASISSDPQSCVVAAGAGRSIGRLQPLPCTQHDAFAVCASCKAPLRWDPGISLWKSGNYRYLEGACAAVCPAGFYDGEGACVACRPGSHQPVEGLEPACLPCQPGHVAPAYHAPLCDPCPPGSFQAREGEVECEACPPNSYQELPGQAACVPCAEGSASPPASSSPDACLPSTP